MTKGAGRPPKADVCFKIIPEITTMAIPQKYIEGPIQLLSGNKAAAKSTNTGILALQGIKGVSIIVIRLSRIFSIVRLAIIPGTLQPVPISNGIKDLPDNPKRRKIL